MFCPTIADSRCVRANSKRSMTGGSMDSTAHCGARTVVRGAAVAPIKAAANEIGDEVVGGWQCWRLTGGNDAVDEIDGGAAAGRSDGGVSGCSFLYFLRASSKLTFSRKLIALVPCSRCQVGHTDDVTGWLPSHATQCGGAVHTSSCQSLPQLGQMRGALQTR